MHQQVASELFDHLDPAGESCLRVGTVLDEQEVLGADADRCRSIPLAKHAVERGRQPYGAAEEEVSPDSVT